MHFKTTLLCFVHGFKGNDDTFGDFPKHLKQLIKDSAPDQNIEARVYPKYETKGDLPSAVLAFREWLVTQVLSLEKESDNPSPIKAPSVGVIFVGHSMGGLVVSDALFSFIDDINGGVEEKKLTEETDGAGSREQVVQSEREAMFPAIQGVLTFDTPFCGLSRAMFAYGAFAQYQQVSSVYGLATSFSSLSFPTSASSASTQAGRDTSPAFKLWQAIAMRTGAAGAIAAAGAAAYMYREQLGEGLGYLDREHIVNGLSSVNRDNIKQMFSQVSSENIQQGLAYISRENLSHGLAWLSGHLQFVGALMCGAELQDRIGRLSAMGGLGFANLYTSLGENSYWSGGYFVAERTFCAVPPEKTEPNKHYIREVNSKVKDEIEAHTNMFNKERNPGYEELSDHAKGLVLTWMRSYEGRLRDPHPQRRQKLVGLAANGERTTAKYPGLTIYSYDEQRGFQESKTPGWLPSMPAVPAMPSVPAVPKPTYPSMPTYSYPSMPTYEGMTQYLPSIPHWGRKPGPKASDGSRLEAESANTEGEDTINAVVDEAAHHPLLDDGDELLGDDQNLLGTLRRTGSIPGVTEDLFFQRTDEPYETQADVDASKDKSLGASMAEDIPTGPGQFEADNPQSDAVQGRPEGDHELPDTQATRFERPVADAPDDPLAPETLLEVKDAQTDEPQASAPETSEDLAGTTTPSEAVKA